MPRVVADQREKFENDELFRKLARESEVRYTGYRDRPVEERKVRFQVQCKEGHAEIAFVSCGINLHLAFHTNSWPGREEDRQPTKEYVDFDRDPGKVHLRSEFIMNGVCVVWRGWVDLQRLDGTARLEFDEARARIEDRLLREEVDQFGRRRQTVGGNHNVRDKDNSSTDDNKDKRQSGESSTASITKRSLSN